jgi:GNAT superfamily N-acetyltransferase
MAELGYPTAPEEMAARLEVLERRVDFATFVAEADGTVAGMIGVTVSPSLYRSDLLGAIVALVVSSEFRGRGIAARLVDQGEQWLRDAGARRATVNPSAHREDAHRLYARLGYEATGVRFSKALG